MMELHKGYWISGSAVPNSRCKQIFGLALSVGLLALCLPAQAQQTGKIFRIGFLDNTTASGSAVLVNVFLEELAKLGWIEGKNIALESRFTEQKNERLPEFAADLVQRKVDLNRGHRRTGSVGSKGSNQYHTYRNGAFF